MGDPGPMGGSEGGGKEGGQHGLLPPSPHSSELATLTSVSLSPCSVVEDFLWTRLSLQHLFLFPSPEINKICILKEKT